MPFAQPVQDRYSALRDFVLVHAGSNDRAPEHAAFGDGIVLRGRKGFDVARTWPADVPTLLDRERYVLDRDCAADVQLLPETAEEAVGAQVDAGAACLLSPSSFPTDRTETNLRFTMEAGHEFVEAARRLAPDLPVFVTVVARYDELSRRTWTRIVAEAELPVATVFAGYGDPLSQPGCLAGAVELIRAAPAVLPLRCDMSVAGFLALGAVAGAIGASSTVRHLYLPAKGKKSRHGRTSSLFVPRFATWMKAGFVEAAQADPDLDDLFRCECPVCGPAGDVRTLVGPYADAALRDNHSIAAAVSLAQAVTTEYDRLRAWRNVLERALDAYDVLTASGIVGPSHGFAQAWLDVIG